MKHPILLALAAFIGLSLLTRGCGDVPEEKDDQQKLIGSWTMTDGENKNSTIEFTAGGGLILNQHHEYLSEPNQVIGKYQWNEDSLNLLREGERQYDSIDVDVEFIDNDQMMFVVTSVGGDYLLSQVSGRWLRAGKTAGDRSGPLAMLVTKRDSLSKRRAALGELIECSEQEKTDAAAQLKAMGATSASSVPNTASARHHVKTIDRLAKEIASLERTANDLDTAISKIGIVIRRSQQSQAAVSEQELESLLTEFRSTENDMQDDLNPIQLESLLDSVLR